MWVLADVYESELPTLHVGGQAQVIVGGRPLNGRVTFIGPVIAAPTRTASVRIELENPIANAAASLLKPDMFVDVILQEPVGKVLAIPDSAVMNTGTRSVIFIAHDDGTFEPRQVTPGAKVQGFYEIRSGVTAGERVVAEANFLVDSESRLESALSQIKPETKPRNQKPEGGGDGY